MSAVSKIQANLASATQETTLALANLNFDFSLWKVEAPPAYQPLGAALSVQRRSAAENGTPHAIARRLGSLFETLLPQTPGLIRAYGTRASEISQAPGVNPLGSKAHGPFQKFVGLDGTSIWAAATSGSSAVAVHLLACMLARAWPSAEAVSIWEELVTERKKTLIPNHDEDIQSVSMKDVVAAQLVITQEQLAEWDASARAWLRAADVSSTTEKQQRDLMKVLNGVSMPVGGLSLVYDNVCEAWVTALVVIDKLVQGHPYSAQDGAVLMALSSWHLYPDLIVLGTPSLELRLHDPLLAPGAALTIGLQHSDRDASLGVHWSLSLAHLRYYGAPVLAQARIDTESSRLTFSQFLLVTLGALIASWGLPTSQIHEAAELVILMKSCLSSRDQRASTTLDWLRPLNSAAVQLTSAPEGRDGPSKLVRLGYRRQSILTEAPPNQIFYLRSMDLGCVMSSIYHQIDFYRSAFRKWDKHNIPLVLRVASKDSDEVAFATVLPDRHVVQNSDYSYSIFVVDKRFIESKPWRTDTRHIYDSGNVTYTSSGINFTWKSPPRLIPSSVGPGAAAEVSTARGNQRSTWSFTSRKSSKAIPPREEPPPLTFEFVGGTLEQVSLYCAKGHAAAVRQFGDSQVDLHMLTEAFTDSIVDCDMLATHFSELTRSDCGWVFQSCNAIEHAARLYECMPSATISPKILETPKRIAQLYWASQLIASDDPEYPSKVQMSRAVAFSCIAYFESGFIDLPGPEYLENVMAISSGDSLYVAAPLLCDPASDLKPYEVHRVVGNIGRAGLAFLIPPQTPMVRPAKSESWRLVNHEPFDGKLEDSFRSTTLHLGFTGYEVPLTLSDHGGRFVEGFFIEAVVSVHESGRWVADLDVLSTLAAPTLFSLLQQPTCEQSSPAGTTPQVEVISLDNWDELLDPPNSASVIRAHGNWQARLAAANISVMLGHSTILFRGHGCWTCAVKVLEEVQSPKADGLITAGAADVNDGPGTKSQAACVFVL